MASDVPAICLRAARSVVLVESGGGGGNAVVGAGVIVGVTDLVVTNHHVARAEGAICVTMPDGRILHARREHCSASHDFALLRLEGRGGFPMGWAPEGSVHVGTRVMAIGNPHGAGKRVTFGRITGINVMTTMIGDGYCVGGSMISACIEAHPGNSGGALCDEGGRLVGIVTGGVANMCSAIPVGRVRRLVEMLVTGLRVSGGWIGLAGEMASAYGGRHWIVRDVARGGPAARAGVLTGDAVIAFNGVRIDSEAELIAYVAGGMPGTAAVLQLIRRGALLEKVAIIAPHPDARMRPEGRAGL